MPQENISGLGFHSECHLFFSPPGEGGLQSLLGNMSHNQLMQLIGPTGLGGIGTYSTVASQINPPRLQIWPHENVLIRQIALIGAASCLHVDNWGCFLNTRWSRGSGRTWPGQPAGQRQQQQQQRSCSQQLLHKVS